MLASELRDFQPGAAQAIGSVQEAAVRVGTVVGRGRGAQTRITRRIETLDDRLNVERRPVGRDVSGHCRNRHDFQPRIEQSEGQGQGVVDSRIAVDNDLAGHAIIRAVPK